MSKTKPLLTEKEKKSLQKVKKRMFQDLENLWSDFGLTLEELRTLKTKHQTK